MDATDSICDNETNADERYEARQILHQAYQDVLLSEEVAGRSTEYIHEKYDSREMDIYTHWFDQRFDQEGDSSYYMFSYAIPLDDNMNPVHVALTFSESLSAEPILLIFIPDAHDEGIIIAFADDDQNHYRAEPEQFSLPNGGVMLIITGKEATAMYKLPTMKIYYIKQEVMDIPGAFDDEMFCDKYVTKISLSLTEFHRQYLNAHQWLLNTQSVQ